jgi:hypothetical protein
MTKKVCDMTPEEHEQKKARDAAWKREKRADPAYREADNARTAAYHEVEFEIDHEDPLRWGGAGTIENLQCLTIEDHAAKTREEHLWNRLAA